EHLVQTDGNAARIVVRSLHRFCREQLLAHRLALPDDKLDRSAYADALVRRFIEALDAGRIPRGEWNAVLVDEAHDFEPDWLRLVVRCADPETNALLVLYDGAQRLYGRSFSLASVGIQAQGRTTILRTNYRNTVEVLALARRFAPALAPPAELG